jgi:hypothetical protein
VAPRLVYLRTAHFFVVALVAAAPSADATATQTCATVLASHRR